MSRVFLIQRRMDAQTRSIRVLPVALVGLLCHGVSIQEAGQDDPASLTDGTPLQGE